MKHKLKLPTLKWRSEYGLGLLLFAVLILLLITSGFLTRDIMMEGAAPWRTPAITPSTPTPAATPGWWDNLPTPDPLFPTPTPGGAF